MHTTEPVARRVPCGMEGQHQTAHVAIIGEGDKLSTSP